jgi:hypothetical protein
MEKIDSFDGKYRFLSNFYHPCLIYYEGLMYLNSEAAYQAAKTTDTELRKQFQNLEPNDSKKLGRRIKIREDWDQVKLQVMWEILWYKFTSHQDLKDALIRTGDAYLEEGNSWNDVYWGVCDELGMNHLGRLLMELRNQILPSL